MAGTTEGMVTMTGTEHDGAGVDPSASAAPDTEDLIITDTSDVGVHEAATSVNSRIAETTYTSRSLTRSTNKGVPRGDSALQPRDIMWHGLRTP